MSAAPHYWVVPHPQLCCHDDGRPPPTRQCAAQAGQPEAAPFSDAAPLIQLPRPALSLHSVLTQSSLKRGVTPHSFTLALSCAAAAAVLSVVDLSPFMSPLQLAEQAVDLNLRLMRWRAAPDLDIITLAGTRCLLLGGCARLRLGLAATRGTLYLTTPLVVAGWGGGRRATGKGVGGGLDDCPALQAPKESAAGARYDMRSHAFTCHACVPLLSAQVPARWGVLWHGRCRPGGCATSRLLTQHGCRTATPSGRACSPTTTAWRVASPR